MSQGSEVQVLDSQFVAPKTQFTDPFCGDGMPDGSDDIDAFLAKVTASRSATVAEKNVAPFGFSTKTFGLKRLSSPETSAFRMAPVLMKGKPLPSKLTAPADTTSGRKSLLPATEQKGDGVYHLNHCENED